MTTSDPRDQLQAVIGTHYTIVRELGRGGMATVYLAEDAKHHRSVALKVLNVDLATNLGSERFRREIAVAAKLHHPHILTVLDSGETPSGLLWFTMPYVEGESLRDHLRRQRQLPLDDALRITREIALALDYAHRHGIIHRDIKPENILLVDGQAMIADFGIARPTAPTTPGETLTATGMSVGTPAYMSPEQAAGERDVAAATDIYSLGVVLYEMLAGEPPYTGPTAQAVAAKMMAGEPPSIRLTRPSVPQGVDAAAHKALSPVPADRFPTAAAFASALDTAERTAYRSGADAAATSRRRIPTGAAVLGLAVLIGAGLLFAWRRHESGVATAAAAGPVGVAVLPFDAGGDTTNAYFADGIADEIRGKLSALPALEVIARTSSNTYRHTPKPADQIGRELGVQYLLTGTVQWERGPGNTRRVRVSPELVEVSAGRSPVTKWQQSYDTTLADVFDVQGAVATEVADRLGVVLSPSTRTQFVAHPTQNLAAYDAYLRSVALRGFDPPTIRRALAAAEQAVALDSDFAAAWAQVSMCHSNLFNVAPVSTRADLDAARRAAERAIALAPAAAVGYIARGNYEGNALDFQAARAAYEKALQLDPSSVLANSFLAFPEAGAGHWAAALAHARHAVALDPRSPDAATALSGLLLEVRQYPEARAEAERGLALAPADITLIANRVLSRLGEGDLPGARAALRDVPPTLDRAPLTAHLSTLLGIDWALDSADRALVLTLPPSAFDNDRGAWGLTLADLNWLAHDTVRAQSYADSARVAIEATLRARPEDMFERQVLGTVLAFLGQRTAAVQEGVRGLALAQATKFELNIIPSARTNLAYIYVIVGDRTHAIAQLDSMLAKPHRISPAWLKIDPSWAPLRGDPRFQRLIATPTRVGPPSG